MAANCQPRRERPWETAFANGSGSEPSADQRLAARIGSARPVITVRPPARGTGVSWIFRWPGASIRPTRRHHRRHNGSEAADRAAPPMSAKR